MFREMFLIHRNQTVFPNRCCMPGFSGFSGTKFSTREFVLQRMGIEAGGLEECKEKMVHISFVLGFLKSHVALTSGMAEHKDSHQPSRNQILTWEGNTGGLEGTWRDHQARPYSKYKKTKKSPEIYLFGSTSLSANIRSPMNKSCIARSLGECVFTRPGKVGMEFRGRLKAGRSV